MGQATIKNNERTCSLSLFFTTHLPLAPQWSPNSHSQNWRDTVISFDWLFFQISVLVTVLETFVSMVHMSQIQQKGKVILLPKEHEMEILKRCE
ncbi:hypothetical protein CEXT_71941 [Caerostris extrusa]|uniref:Uncharacterized protein n=1 Tax=Caerostris extrusa TaxID=172846 RepID=A0AAV4QBN3_CAEEX|nr:hypothetical protein CEXT_71941 [Caerostris extrusa]